MKYQFLSYCTEYSSKGTDNKKMGREVCFAKVFHYYREKKEPQKNYYRVRIYKGDHKAAAERLDNNCFVSIQEVRNHLDIMRNYVKFHYKVFDKGEFYLVHLHIEGANIYHRLILTWLRYLYEFPYNLIVKEMLRIRKQKTKINSLSNMNLFNLIGQTIAVGGQGGHSIIMFWGIYKFLTNDEIKESLKTHNDLNNLFPLLERNYDKARRMLERIGDYNKGVNSKFWESDEEFKKRLELYEKNYVTIKQKSHDE